MFHALCFCTNQIPDDSTKKATRFFFVHHQSHLLCLVLLVFYMALFTNSTKNPLTEVLVAKDDAPLEEVSQDQASDGPCLKVKRKSGPKKDYSLFLEDDFNIDCVSQETSHLKNKRLLKIAQWVLLVLLLAALICTLSISVLKVLEIWDVPVWKWELLLLVIICGKLISGWGVAVAVSLIESNFHLRIGVLYVVYGIRQSIQNVIWLCLVMIACHFVLTDKSLSDSNTEVPRILKKVMLCLLVGTLIWLLKTIIVKILAACFHLISFFRRIRVSLYKQYVIKKLGGDLIEGKNREETCGKLSRHVLGKKKLVAMKVKQMIEIVQAGDLPRLSTVEEDLPVRSDEEDEDEYSLRKRYQDVKVLASEIFRRVAQNSMFDLKSQPAYHFLSVRLYQHLSWQFMNLKRCITMEDLKHRLGGDKLAKPQELFAGSMCKEEITEDSFSHWMVEAHRERRTLALSVNDTKTAVDDLHHIMNVIVTLTILVIWLIICGAPVTQFLIFVTTQLALGAYVFGTTGKTIFESIIFLFIMHPYDVGDRCEVDGTEMIVDEISILTTVFMKKNGQKIIYPNSVLATKSIGNYSRSLEMGDEINFSINIYTPGDKIEKLKKEIEKYVKDKSHHWLDDVTIVVKGVEDMNRLNMVLWPKHVVNHHNMTQRWIRRSELILEMIKIFRKLDIEYNLPPLDIHVKSIGGLISNTSPLK
ncbi:mechanosensitive ion channel MscS, LSM domain protein [Artemisia annua]|uniref:Mechanosensitive ion channel protein n=1 Tax=Artemisia annua TaxID=35608 RepID=A0A2U1NZ80_ARTAN|nr:mechanosensitive ion channel MscS, LSM domain protein [Artemisia annua]